MAMKSADTEDGVALAMAVKSMLLIGAIGAAVLLLSSSETIIAVHFRGSVESRYAAEAVMVRAIVLLRGVADWAGPIAGATQSALVDGAPSGPRTVPGGATIDLIQVVNLANCRTLTACSQTDLAAVTEDRPWGVNNPVWRLYAYGPLSTVLAMSSGNDPPHYGILLVADDPAGTHRPPVGGAPPAEREGIALRAEVFGPRGAHAVLETIASRAVATDGTDYNSGAVPSMNILSWREVR
jgi:hypothetical protein